MSKVRLAALVSAASLAAILVVTGCTEGTTPDCSGANAAKCAPSLDASTAADVSLVLPEAAPPASSDAGDAGDASDGGDPDGGLLDGG